MWKAIEKWKDMTRADEDEESTRGTRNPGRILWSVQISLARESLWQHQKRIRGKTEEYYGRCSLSKVTFFDLYGYYAFMNIFFSNLVTPFKQAILNTRHAMTFIKNLSFELRDRRV
jgi:hypothetical protein